MKKIPLLYKMKTEIENYLDFVDGFLDKDHRFLIEVKPAGKDNKKSLEFCEVMDFKELGITGIKPYPYLHFRFVSKRLDKKAIENLEQGLVNLAGRGYKIDYYNTAK